MKVLHHGGRFGNTKENIRSGLLSNVEFPTGFHPQPGRIKDLTHTHTCSLCIRKYISYQRQKFNSAFWILQHFLRNFPTTFGDHPTGIFPPQIPLQKWQLLHFPKHSTFFPFFFHVFLWYPLGITRKNEGKKNNNKIKIPNSLYWVNALQWGIPEISPPSAPHWGSVFFRNVPLLCTSPGPFLMTMSRVMPEVNPKSPGNLMKEDFPLHKYFYKLPSPLWIN